MPGKGNFHSAAENLPAGAEIGPNGQQATTQCGIAPFPSTALNSVR